MHRTKILLFFVSQPIVFTKNPLALFIANAKYSIRINRLSLDRPTISLSYFRNKVTKGRRSSTLLIVRYKTARVQRWSVRLVATSYNQSLCHLFLQHYPSYFRSFFWNWDQTMNRQVGNRSRYFVPKTMRNDYSDLFLFNDFFK